MRTVREDAELDQLLGQGIRPQSEWWLNGDPRIHGNVRYLSCQTYVCIHGPLSRFDSYKGMSTLASVCEGPKVRVSDLFARIHHSPRPSIRNWNGVLHKCQEGERGPVYYSYVHSISRCHPHRPSTHVFTSQQSDSGSSETEGLS